MTIAISALKVGDIVYSVRKQRAGNTKSYRTAIFEVKIVEINPDGRSVMASSNNNRSQQFFARNGKFSWRRTKPAAKD